jgi:phage shock protein PspC (stress-responsive transcriptional regulator)
MILRIMQKLPDKFTYFGLAGFVARKIHQRYGYNQVLCIVIGVIMALTGVAIVVIILYVIAYFIPPRGLPSVTDTESAEITANTSEGSMFGI